MMIIRGVNVFPSQIEDRAAQSRTDFELSDHRRPVNNSDTLDVNVEMTPEMFADSVGTLSQQEKALKGALKSMLGIQANVHLWNQSRSRAAKARPCVSSTAANCIRRCRIWL